MDLARQRAEWGRAALLACLIFNANRDPQKTPPLKPADFNPYAPRPVAAPAPKVRLRDLKAAYVKG
jgi:hypothetical protein